MATVWIIRIAGQDGRMVGTYVRQDGRSFRKVRDVAATQYPDKATADAFIASGSAANPALYTRHSEAVSDSITV